MNDRYVPPIWYDEAELMTVDVNGWRITVPHLPYRAVLDRDRLTFMAEQLRPLLPKLQEMCTAQPLRVSIAPFKPERRPCAFTDPRSVPAAAEARAHRFGRWLRP